MYQKQRGEDWMLRLFAKVSTILFLAGIIVGQLQQLVHAIRQLIALIVP
jgi:hypothetical protein